MHDTTYIEQVLLIFKVNVYGYFLYLHLLYYLKLFSNKNIHLIFCSKIFVTLENLL